MKMRVSLSLYKPGEKWGCKEHFRDRYEAVEEWKRRHPGRPPESCPLPKPIHDPDCPACRAVEEEHHRCSQQRDVAEAAYRDDGTTGWGGQLRAVGRAGRIKARASRLADPGTEDGRPPTPDPIVEAARLEAAKTRLGAVAAVPGWRWLDFKAKPDGRQVHPHGIPPGLYDAVMDDLLKRYTVGEHLLDLSRCKDSIDPYWMDFGGMAQVGEPVATIELPGPRALQFAVHQGPYLQETVEHRLAHEDVWRPSPQGPWVRLHGYWTLCVVTVEELHFILAHLKEKEAEYKEALEEFDTRREAMIDASPRLTRPGKKWPMEPGN